jgi:hypothetical protein
VSEGVRLGPYFVAEWHGEGDWERTRSSRAGLRGSRRERSLKAEFRIGSFRGGYRAANWIRSGSTSHCLRPFISMSVLTRGNPHSCAGRGLAIGRQLVEHDAKPDVRQRPHPRSAHRRVAVEQRVQGRPRPRRVEASEHEHVVHLRAGWIWVKDVYSLTVDEAEKAALSSMLTSC